MAEIPAFSTNNLPSSEKDCCIRRQSENPNEENKRTSLEIKEETSVSPKKNEVQIANYQPVFNSNVDLNATIPVHIEGNNSYQQNVAMYSNVDLNATIPVPIEGNNSYQQNVAMYSNVDLYATYQHNVYGLYHNLNIGTLFSTSNRVCAQYNVPETQSHIRNIVEVLAFSSCVLYPPDPHRYISRRTKPDGCRTVHVRGIKKPLPVKVTQDVIREIFNTREKVIAVQMNSKGVYHVQFSCESEVEEAVKLSGYQIRVENKIEEPYAGWIHVDYEDSNKDQKVLERAEREVKRKARHNFYLQYKRSFTKCEFETLLRKLNEVLSKKEEKEKKIYDIFAEFVRTSKTWFCKGEVNKKNSGDFFNLIQLFNHNLIKNQVGYKNEYESIESEHTKTVSNITSLARYLEKILALVKCQNSLPEKEKLYYHDQIKNIVSGFIELAKDKIDLCEESTSTNINSSSQEVESLRELIKKAEEDIAMLVEKIKRTKEEQENQEQRVKFHSFILESLKEDYFVLKRRLDSRSRAILARGSSSTEILTESKNQMDFYREARLLSLIAPFLSVQLCSVNIDFICTYINKILGPGSSSNILSLMERYPSIFEDEVTGVGESMERKWKLVKKHHWLDLNPRKDGSSSKKVCYNLTDDEE